MILQSLHRLYQRLPDVDRPGFAPMGLSWAIVLSPSGELESLMPLRQKAQRGNKLVPTPVSAPSPGKRTSGNKAGFLADKTDYILGFDPASDGKPAASEKLRQRFELFRDAHLAARDDISHPDFDLVCHFLENWTPQDPSSPERISAAANSSLDEIIGTNLAFQISGKTGFVHQLPEVIDYWSKTAASAAEAPQGFCLVTGKTQSLARLHGPAIKGVAGAQSSGASIVSFNLGAFTSYGKEQSLNAPVSEDAAFAYCTTLNWLLARKERRFRIGDATTVFWTEEPTPIEADFPWMISGVLDAEDESTKKRIQGVLERIARGTLGKDELGDTSVRYFILGLSPNASRLSVRFWHSGNLGELITNLKKHFDHLRLIRQWDESSKKPDPETPSVYQLIRQTARDADGVQPLLAGQLMRSILLGVNYPESLPLAVINRIRAEREVNYLKAAILKAWLVRNHSKSITTMLDENNTIPGYRLGRLFAVLEKTQQDALPGIKATIRERFYASASATPRAVFGRLLRTYQHHLAKLESTGAKIAREKLAQEVLSTLSDFPAHLNLHNQGQFALGYYHQRKDFFTRKESEETVPSEN